MASRRSVALMARIRKNATNKELSNTTAPPIKASIDASASRSMGSLRSSSMAPVTRPMPRMCGIRSLIRLYNRPCPMRRPFLRAASAKAIGPGYDNAGHEAARYVGLQNQPRMAAVQGGQTGPNVDQANPAALGGMEADAIVAHRYLQHRAVGARHDLDASALGQRCQAMLDCIFDQGN